MELSLSELVPYAFAEMAENRADEGAGRVPDDVVDVRDARGEEVLVGLDRARQREPEKEGQDIRLDRRTIDRVQRDEHQKTPWNEQKHVPDDGDEDQREDPRRHRA